MRDLTFLTVLLLVAGLRVTEAAGPCPPSGMAGRYDYQEALCMSILFYEAERSGPLPDDMRFPWRADAALEDGSDVGLDLTGGYFDAGDHVKFGLPMACTVTNLAWGLVSYKAGYEAAGQVEYAEAAIRWATDYFLKAHAAPLTFYGQLGDGNLDHLFWGRPEDMTMERPAFVLNTDAPGSDLVGETVAALAAASLVFESSDPEYSVQLLDAARDLFELAEQYREIYYVSIPNAIDFYRSAGYEDELTWAAIWMYKATGEQDYADRAKGLWEEFDFANYEGGFDWNMKTAGAKVLFAEMFAEEPYVSLVQEYLEGLRGSYHTPGGLVYIDHWGSIRHAVDVALIALKAADLGIDPDINRSWAKQQVDYALGSSGHSYIVGFGVDPPQRPHHRASSCPAPPEECDGDWALFQDGPNPNMIYGALVGGPDENDGWVDDRNNYVQNEVGCDYNAALAGVLAAMVMLN